MSNIRDVAQDFARLFEENNIPYALMGGLAVRLYAVPRPTYDVDFTIALSRDRLDSFSQLAVSRGYAQSEAQLTGWIESVQGLSIIKFQWYHHQHSIDVDLFLAESPFQKNLLTRRKEYQVDDFKAWYVTAEDLILLKLLAYRKKDQVDVMDILFMQGQLDIDYMKKWATQLKISERLESALNQQ